MTDHAEFTKDEYLRRICGEGVKMTVREALERSIAKHDHDRVGRVLNDLAPKIEAALRASAEKILEIYCRGIEEEEIQEAVTAGIEAMQ